MFPNKHESLPHDPDELLTSEEREELQSGLNRLAWLRRDVEAAHRGDVMR